MWAGGLSKQILFLYYYYYYQLVVICGFPEKPVLLLIFIVPRPWLALKNNILRLDNFKNSHSQD